MACVVEDVNAPDGTRSKLFDQLLQVTASDTEALRLYLNVMSEPLNEELIQDNGEPELGDVINRDDLGFTEKHRGLYSTRDYSRATKQTSTTQGVIQQVNHMIEAVKNRLSGNISPGRRERLIERRNALQSQLSDLQGHSTVDEAREVATEHIKWASDLLSNPESLTNDEILLGIQVMDAWDYDTTETYLTEEQKQEDVENPEEATGFHKLFLEMNTKSQNIRDNLIQHAWRRILDDINSEMDLPGGENISLEDIQDLSDQDISERLINISEFFDLSAEDQRMIQRLDEILKSAKRNQATLLREIDEELQEKAEDVENFEVLLQKDENDNLTGGLTNPHNPEFTEEKDDAMNLLEKAQRQARKNGISAGTNLREEFVRSLRSIGEAVDIRYLVDELDSPGEYSSADEYISHLEERVGEKEAERAVRAAREMWQEYTRKREGHIDVIESEIADGKHREEDMTAQEYREERMEQFRRRQSPELLLEEFHEGASPTVFNDGWQHAFIAADPEYQSDRWKGLSEDQRKLANYLRDLYSSLFDLLPDHVSRRKHENFLPIIEKDVVERMMEDGAMAAFSQMGQDWFKEVSGDKIASLTDEESQLPNPLSGLGNKDQVSIRFVNEDNVDISDRSRDILRITEMFAAMAVNYNHMSQVEPIAQLIGRVAKEEVDNPEDSNILDSIEYNLNAMLYDEARERSEGYGFFTSANPRQAYEDMQEARRLERKFRNLEDKWEDGEIERGEYIRKRNKIEGQYADLEGRTIDPWRVIESTVGRFTMLSSIGFNIQTGIANGLFGIMAASVHAAGEQDFTSKDFRNAFMTYWNMKMSGSGKVGNLMTNMDILYEISEIAYGRGRGTEAERRSFVRRVKDSPYALIRNTETMIQSVTMMSIMMNETVEVEMDGETQKISVWEAFNDSGRWDEERFGENEEWQPPAEPAGKNKWTQMRDKVVQVNKRLHGNYDVNSPMDFKKAPLKRLIIMFRTWMPEGFRYRLGKEMWDAQIGRTVKGSYRSLYQGATEHGVVKGPVELWSAAWNRDWKGENSDLELDEIDIRNARKTLKDLQWFLGMSAIMLALKSIIDDDEEDTAREFAAKSVINNLFRVRQDITHYIDPTTPYNLVTNPVPAMRTITEAGRALNATKRELTDPEYQGSASYRWAKTVTPFQQVTDIGTLLWNIETGGEFSTKFKE